MDSRNDVKKFMDAADQVETGIGSQSDLYLKLIREEFDELFSSGSWFARKFNRLNSTEFAEYLSRLRH